MSACWNLFWSLSDTWKRVMETVVLVLTAVVVTAVMLKVPPQTNFPLDLVPPFYQFFGGLINVMALLYFASIRLAGWECGGRMLFVLLLAMAVNTWLTVYALPIALSWFMGDDLWSLVAGVLIVHTAVCVFPAFVYVPFYTRGVNAAKKRKQAEHVASAPVQ